MKQCQAEECPSYLVWPQRDGQSYTLLDTSTTDTLVLDQNFFRPLGMQHFYDSFALVSQNLCPSLFGLREDELLPDLHITREGVLRIGLGAHQEHRVNHEARAADRTKVTAEVVQLAAHEVDPEPTKAESEGGTSDSDGSESFVWVFGCVCLVLLFSCFQGISAVISFLSHQNSSS